ncbi:PadR family transcriptional regulator [Paenibacillus silvisoli]|uniref:PadR family transcriptional regulator n=1 Tax=Paenibacillus silvisoli TaxID=3110539 RepID=UPI0028058E02|nr:PadR family transcriptional regulator [Paenibacillus silvisoli]
MNTLAYGLLSMLSCSPDSGYDLMLKLQSLWPAKHSQIYPLLSQMESDGYVRHVLVPQTDKPDKKVYSLTDMGRDALRAWLAVPANEPVIRDELALKLFAMDQGNPEDIKRQLELRVQYCRDRIHWLNRKIEVYMQKEPPPSRGLLLLMQRGRFSSESDLEWAEWALAQLREE